MLLQNLITWNQGTLLWRMHKTMNDWFLWSCQTEHYTTRHITMYMPTCSLIKSVAFNIQCILCHLNV